MILGITGTFGAGKDTVAEYIFAKTGWTHFSTSDELRAECVTRGRSVDREAMRHTGNELRKERGGGILAERTLEKIHTQGVRNAIVTGIRNPSEVAALRATGSFVFIHVDAPISLRYQRIISRAREGEEILSFDQFKAQEDTEKINSDPTMQQLDGVKQLADIKLVNDGTLVELQQKIDLLLKSIF